MIGQNRLNHSATTPGLGDTADLQQLIRVAVRLLAALGCAVFVLGASEHGFDNDAVSRVIQGVVTGVGFLGAGTILKRTSHNTIKGLTTAGSVWVTATIGIAAGLGQIAVTMVAVVLTWIVLSILVSIENRMNPRKNDDAAQA